MAGALVVINGKEKKPKINWEQGEVCTPDGACADDPNYNRDGGQFSVIFENKTSKTLHGCYFAIPLDLDGTIAGRALGFADTDLPPNSKLWVRASASTPLFRKADEMDVKCDEGGEAIRFRFPVFQFWLDQRKWRKDHEGDSSHGRDPNR